MTAERPNFERGGNAQILEWDVAELEAILGEELDFEPPETIEEYDEHRQIALDTQEAAKKMRENNRRVAEQQLGMTITEEQLAGWRPNRAEVSKLRSDLLRQRKMLRMIRGAEEYIQDQADEARARGVPLRKHQQQVVTDFSDFLRYKTRSTPEGGKTGLIEMPTGTGKTGIFANIAAALKHDEIPGEPVRVLVLVPRQQILKQTMGRQGERGFGKFAPHLDVGAYYEDEKDLSHEVTVMCAASFNELMRQGCMPDFDAIIVDEAHTVIGDATADNLRAYGADKLMIGLTATAEFDEERTAYQLFEHTITQMDLPDAVKGGLLAPVRAELKETKVKVDWRTLPKEPAAQKAALRAARLEARMEAAVEIIKKELERGVGVVVRCPAGDDIDHAVRFSETLRELLVKEEGLFGLRWINAQYVGGSSRRQSKREREGHFEDYDRGDIDVLCYVKAIGMGWDSPHAKVLINLAPTTSRVEMVQAIGRVLRLSQNKEGEAIEARVYDFKDPDLGDKQYTPLMALKLENGQLLSHEPSEAPIPRPRKNRRKPRAEIMDVTTTTVGATAIENEVEVVWPTQSEIDATIAARGGETPIPIDEVSRILGVSPPTAKGMLLGLGSNPKNPIMLKDVRAMLDLYPDLEAPELPESGYTEALELSKTAPRYLKLLSMMRYARINGMHPRRFTGTDGKIRFYFDDDTAQRLMQEIAEREYNI